MNLTYRTLVVVMLVARVATAASAQTAPITRVEKRVLTLEGARAVAEAAVAEAARLHTTGAIAIVDDGGNLLYLVRLDNTFPAGASVATGKARTAATFRMPTRNLEDAVKNGRTSLVAVGEMTPLAGGVPIVVGGQIVGAVGVSGAASAAQDEELATVAARALAEPSTASSNGNEHPNGAAGGSAPVPSEAVVRIPAREVEAAFAKGGVLVNNGRYQVHASRREAPGQAEVHERDTDIIHVLEGTTTFVTGGTVVAPATTAPGEIRGASIEGGQARTLGKGDVVVVPQGTPHWFKDVAGPVLYYVVKVQ